MKNKQKMKMKLLTMKKKTIKLNKMDNQNKKLVMKNNKKNKKKKMKNNQKNKIKQLRKVKNKFKIKNNKK